MFHRRRPQLGSTVRSYAGLLLGLCVPVAAIGVAEPDALAQAPQPDPAPAPAPAPAPDGEKAAEPGAVGEPGEKPADPPPAPEPPLMGPAPTPTTPPAPTAPPPTVPAPATPAPATAAPATPVRARPTGEERALPTSEVYAEDWWNLSRPVFEFHGYYRVRSEFFHNFDLGRRDGDRPLWPQPPDNDYIDTNGNRHRVELCGDDPDNPTACDNSTQSGANMRFRFSPELHISDNLRIRTQIDILDNLVLGSTPEGYANRPSGDGGYQVVARGGYSPTGSLSTTQWAPSAGVNSAVDSISVKRVWGEYSTPIGQLRFGRMPNHWGLGMLFNAGDGYDSDWQSTSDRLMFMTGIKDWDLYFGAAWDFANEGAISANLNEQQGQPYDLGQKDDVDQFVFIVARKQQEQFQRKDLAMGKPVINGGGYFVYRRQTLANDTTDPTNGASIGADPSDVSNGYVRRGAEAFIPDLWFQFKYKTFSFDMEAAMIWGSVENTSNTPGASNYVNGQDPSNNGWDVRQFGITTQAEFRALEDRLSIQLGFGLATGDSDVDNLAPVGNGTQPQLTADRTDSTFRFHPNYRVDLILFRNVLNRVQGAYYFRPSIAYDFFRDPDGQKIGGSAAVIWSRATEFAQAPGHSSDLGVELNFQVYFQAKDGVLNDDPDKMGGFFTMLQYGVLFPLGGLGYLPGQVTDYTVYQNAGDEPLDTETAQTIRWYVGILY